MERRNGAVRIGILLLSVCVVVGLGVATDGRSDRHVTGGPGAAAGTQPAPPAWGDPTVVASSTASASASASASAAAGAGGTNPASGQPPLKLTAVSRVLGGTTDLHNTKAYPDRAIVPGPLAVPAGGVALAPGANLQQAIDSHPAGTQFNLAAGTYGGGVVHPKAGDKFYGVKAGPGGTVLQGVGIHRADSGTIDVEIHNLTITGFSDAGRDGAIDSNYHESSAASGWKITNSEISGNAIGASLGPNSLVENNTFHDNSCKGAAGGMHATTWRYNQFINNETALNSAGDCGGSVQTVMTDNLFAGNVWSQNGHPSGLWMYGGSRDNTFDGNLFYNNNGSGLLDQTGTGNTFTNNIVAGNGRNTPDAWRRTGIVIQSSAHDTVSGNYVWGNNSGAILIYMESRTEASGLDRNAYNSVTGNVVDKAVDISYVNITGPNTVESNRVSAPSTMTIPTVKAGPQA
jgi:parallel beta-helix repeat protein